MDRHGTQRALVSDGKSMNIIFTVLWLSLQPTNAEAECLRSTAPNYLTVDSAKEHIAAARFAGLLYHLDPSVILAVSWHESRFNPKTVTKEPGHRVSCGVGTPVPKRYCTRDELTVLGGYLALGKHLRMWVSVYGIRDGLTAYAGGGLTVLGCKKHGRVRAPSGRNACNFSTDILKMANKIERAMTP